MGSIHELLSKLSDAGVEFVLIGGMAAMVHGSPLFTEDLDVCISTTPENFARIIEALRGTNPKFRMRPDRPQFFDDPERLHGFKNLNLVTDLGQIDLLGELTGVGGYAEALAHSVIADLKGRPTRVLDLDTLIQAKRSAGRPKDVPHILQLEKLQKHRIQRKTKGKTDVP